MATIGRCSVKTRSAKGAETRLRIIRAASDLFHKQGIRLTSPDDVIEASGTGKGQFYHYFENKEGLVHGVLQYHLDAIKTGTAPINYEIKSWPDLEQWFLAHIQLQKRFHMTRGCPFGTIANEVTGEEELLRQDLNVIFELIRNKLAAFFAREKASARLSKRASEVQMADFCIAAIQGAMLVGKIWKDGRPAERIVQEALNHLKRYAVSPR